MQRVSDLSGDIVDRRTHVPGPPGQMPEPQACPAVSPEPLAAYASHREAFKAAMAERHHTNRHPDNGDHESRKRQNACGDKYRKRQTDSEWRAGFHFAFAPFITDLIILD